MKGDDYPLFVTLLQVQKQVVAPSRRRQTGLPARRLRQSQRLILTPRVTAPLPLAISRPPLRVVAPPTARLHRQGCGPLVADPLRRQRGRRGRP